MKENDLVSGISIQPNQEYCYQNVSDNPDDPIPPDYEELFISISEDSKVMGTYNWLPAEKDSERGTLTGDVINNMIKANYTSIQEGLVSSDSIDIYLNDNNAILVRHREYEEGIFPDTTYISKIPDCKSLTE